MGIGGGGGRGESAGVAAVAFDCYGGYVGLLFLLLQEVRDETAAEFTGDACDADGYCHGVGLDYLIYLGT